MVERSFTLKVNKIKVKMKSILKLIILLLIFYMTSILKVMILQLFSFLNMNSAECISIWK